MGEMVGISIGSYDFISYKNTFSSLLTIFHEGDINILSENIDGEFCKRFYFSTTVTREKNVWMF